MGKIPRYRTKDLGDGPGCTKVFEIAFDSALRAPARHHLHAIMVEDNNGRPREFTWRVPREPVRLVLES